MFTGRNSRKCENGAEMQLLLYMDTYLAIRIIAAGGPNRGLDSLGFAFFLSRALASRMEDGPFARNGEYKQENRHGLRNAHFHCLLYTGLVCQPFDVE